MDITNKIQGIKQAHSENKLVVFVGAGVSRNSGYPIWNDLVRQMDFALGNSPIKDRTYSNDELLRIPQYLFQSDKKRYYSILEENYGNRPKKTNSIIDKVLELNPHHIITTNYDEVIEYSIEAMMQKGFIEGRRQPHYSIVQTDKDLIGVSQDRLLIKMHGDLSEKESIVLKEEDYLNFENTHPFIVAYVKALLIDHSFLFLGYGVGDYNLKLLMNWVENLVSTYNKSGKKTQRKQHFFFHSDGEIEIPHYEKVYFASKNIEIIEYNECPNHIQEIETDTINNEIGKNVYRFIQYVIDGAYVHTSIEFITERLSRFSSQKMILFEDLMGALGEFQNPCFSKIGNNLYVWYPIETENSSVDIILKHVQNRESNLLVDIFSKTGISEVITPENSQIPVYIDIKSFNIDNTDTQYKNLLEFDFRKLRSKISSPKYSDNDKLFIQLLLGNQEDAENFIIDKSKNLKFQDYIQQAIFMHNASQLWVGDTYEQLELCQWIKRLPKDMKQYITPLCDLDDGFITINANWHNEAQKIMIRNRPENRTRVTHLLGSANSKIETERTRIWDRISYYLINGIYTFGCNQMSTNLGGFKNFILAYMDSLFYFVSEIGANTSYPSIRVSNIDLFMIIAYLDNSTLSILLRKYEITQLTPDNESVEYLLIVLSNSAKEQLYTITNEAFAKPFLSDVMCNCLALIKLFELSEIQEKQFSNILCNITLLATEEYPNDGEVFLRIIFPMVVEELMNLTATTVNDSIVTKTKSTLTQLIIKFVNENHNEGFSQYFEIFLSKYRLVCNLSSVLAHRRRRLEGDYIDAYISIHKTYHWYGILPLIDIYPICGKKNKLQIKELIKSKIQNLGSKELFFSIYNLIIDFNKQVSSRFEELCELACRNRKTPYYLDQYDDPLHVIVRLHEKGFIVDIEPFYKYAVFFPLLSFVCFPERFDFSLFEINWYTWLELPHYREIALEKAEDILKQKFMDAIKNGADNCIRKMYYSIFPYYNNPQTLF